MNIKDLPATAWTAIWGRTTLATATCVLVSVAASHAIMSAVAGGLSAGGLAAATLMPLLIGGPMSFWHLVRVAQLRHANEKLQVLASTDWLTGCLNRRAFTQAVAARNVAEPGGTSGRGALLVIDADHFKVINDVFGHDRGDEALQLMAAVIRSKVREGDLVCRMGGEEFGAFLPGADHDTANLVAERIRRGIARLAFAPADTAHQLSVSIGAAVFDGDIEFSALFRVADQRLYLAKQSGRNRCEVGVAPARSKPAGQHPPRQGRLYIAGVR